MTMDWRELAACRGYDPELFFPVGDTWEGKGNARRAEVALAICADCPIREQCLADALERGDVWAILGGTLPEERRAPARVA
jgi:WhiB family redox-sensing transcriptional regulator